MRHIHLHFVVGILSLPLTTIITGTVNVAVSIMLQLLALSIAQCTLDQEKESWKAFFDQAPAHRGSEVFNQLLIIYENRLNTESNDTLKMTVSNMIKSLLNVSMTAKQEAIRSMWWTASKRFIFDASIEIFQKDSLNLKSIISSVFKQN